MIIAPTDSISSRDHGLEVEKKVGPNLLRDVWLMDLRVDWLRSTLDCSQWLLGLRIFLFIYLFNVFWVLLFVYFTYDLFT